MLGLSTAYSLRLLALGYLTGTVAGVGTGILMGWYKQGEYWLQPVLRAVLAEKPYLREEVSLILDLETEGGCSGKSGALAGNVLRDWAGL